MLGPSKALSGARAKHWKTAAGRDRTGRLEPPGSVSPPWETPGQRDPGIWSRGQNFRTLNSAHSGWKRPRHARHRTGDRRCGIARVWGRFLWWGSRELRRGATGNNRNCDIADKSFRKVTSRAGFRLSISKMHEARKVGAIERAV